MLFVFPFVFFYSKIMVNNKNKITISDGWDASPPFLNILMGKIDPQFDHSQFDRFFWSLSLSNFGDPLYMKLYRLNTENEVKRKKLTQGFAVF